MKINPKVLAGCFAAYFALTGAAASAITIEFRKDVSNGLFPLGYTGAQDAQLVSSAPDNSDNGASVSGGAHVVMTVGALPSPVQERKLLFSYDISAIASLVSPGQQLRVNSAVLTFRTTRNNGFTDALIELFEIDSANAGWAEPDQIAAGGSSSEAADPGEVTWNNLAHDATPWAGSAGLSTPGTDFNATPLSSFTYLAAGASTQFFNVPLPTSLAQDWIENPSDNAGFFLRSDTVGGNINGINVFAGESPSNPTTRPLLTIDFTVEDADFNSNGAVDGADFLAWQRGFGIGTGALNTQGDANMDGAVNSADLDIWESQFGPLPSSLAAATSAVPEPTTLLSAIMAAGLLFGVRRRVLGVRRPT